MTRTFVRRRSWRTTNSSGRQLHTSTRDAASPETSFALTSELLATRDRMSMYRLDNPTSIPLASRYWMTSFRYTIGFKYNATRALNLAQNPMH